ncbi:MAG: type II toxin-antitoxin system PemK/MazF family toxin [Candidatus Bathyarchaeota archaeon]|nr:type II toxin-antitoxin system PemK/MazF family toxin [Candidatus Bathyarchaeota archaeon]
MKGKIVLIPFPFTDLSGSKRRPALVLLQSGHDVVVSYISSKTTTLSEACILIKENDPDFSETGLKTSSVLRLDKLATILTNLVLGEIGEIKGSLKNEINRKLVELYRI